MPVISEKDILENIKQSVETEAPDVWKKIQDAEKCKYDYNTIPSNSNKRRLYVPVAAALIFAIIGFAGMKMNFFAPRNQGGESLALGSGKNYNQGTIAPGLPQTAEDSAGRMGVPYIAIQYTKDADVIEASKALKFDVAVPSWMPTGFTKVSSKLYFSDKEESQPYMYNIEYKNDRKKLLTVSVTKYITEEEKLRSQPNSVPQPEDKGASILPTAPPDAKPQSIPGYNPSSPASPPTATDTPSYSVDGKTTPEGPNMGGGSGSSTGNAGTAAGGKPVSVDFSSVKIKSVDVSLTVTSSGEYGSVSAFWIYNGGSYNIYSDGISKDELIKIVETMIK